MSVRQRRVQPAIHNWALAHLRRLSKELSLQAICDQVQALLESVTNMSEQIKQIGEDPTLAAFEAEMEVFAKEATKVREEIVSLRGLMMQKLQSMIQHFGERKKASRGRQEVILRMLYELTTDIDAGLVRSKELRERQRKQAAKAEARKVGNTDDNGTLAAASAALGGRGRGRGRKGRRREKEVCLLIFIIVVVLCISRLFYHRRMCPIHNPYDIPFIIQCSVVI